MESPREERLERLFEEALALPAERRAAWLEQSCAGEPELREQLEALLAQASEAHTFVERVMQPAVARAAGAILAEPGAEAEAPIDPLVGRQVAHFEVLEKLGGGGMGVVYRARDVKLERIVALKFLPPHLGLDEDAKQRFIREARTASALDHPHICTVHEIGETSAGELFIAMAYYPGETLKQKIARGPLPIDEVVGYAAQIADGLAAAHGAGIVHRDIKPANLLVSTGGTVKILDFGLAKLPEVSLTRPGVMAGTLAYMSPEQVRGESVDQRTDLWSLGVVLYEMLTGVRPFRAATDSALLVAIEHRDPEPLRSLRPEVPEESARAVEKLLRKDPEGRYRTAEELIRDLMGQRPALAMAAAPPQDSSFRVRTRWRPAAAIGAALLLGAAVLASMLSRPTPATAPFVALVGAEQSRVASLAVLPLKNLSSEAGQDYFADGLTDELITALTKIEGLRVIAHQSVLQFRDSPRSAAEIAAALGVDHLVGGSVLLEGERVRITVSLIDARSNAPVWGERFERDRRNILALQRDVALAISRHVEVTLTPQDRARLAAAPLLDPEAFDLYLRGTQARYRQTPEGWAEAGWYFERAIARDSGYAPAYAGLASVRFFSDDPEAARELADSALALDPGLAEPHLVLGLVQQQYDLDWAAAEEAFRLALRLDPGHAEARHELSMHLMRTRRFDEALQEAQQALYLAPTSARFQHGLGEVLLFSGRYREALAAAERAWALDPGYVPIRWLRAIAYGQLGEYDRAVETLEAASPHWPLNRANLGYVYAVSGERDQALEILGELKSLANSGRDAKELATYGVAMVLAGLGEPEPALDWLERIERPVALSYLAIDPTLRSLHSEPRFQALLTRVGLR